MARLESLTIRGFKTIHELNDFQLGNLTVLIGPNGAGKSNLIGFFRMLNWLVDRNLQEYVGREGGASLLLHDGPQVTPHLEASLNLSAQQGANEFRFRLSHAAEDTLLFVDEAYRFTPQGRIAGNWTSMGAGHRESKVMAEAEAGRTSPKALRFILRKLIVHQFHNTSATARIRQKWSEDDNRWLKEDAANLAPFLARLRESAPPYYQRVVGSLRLILPFFDDFVLEPERGLLLLRWKEKGSDRVFSPAQAADGMLRVMALIALLQQPEQDLPDLLILDEPELGLHPYAIEIVAGMIEAVSSRVQVLVATQSVSLVDRVDPGSIVVVERKVRQSEYRRLVPADLEGWLARYSTSELWEKNVLGGRPS